MNELVTKTTNSLSKMAGRSKLVIQKNSPEILLAAGVIGFVGTVVLACKATLKADEVLEQHQKKMKDINDAFEIAQNNHGFAEDENGEEYDYDIELYKHDKVVQYTKTSVEFVKLYAPSVALGAFSLACILSSRNIMQKRYLGAVAAYNAVSEAFEAYRKRVREEVGELMDRHYRYGTEIEERDVVEVDENGKKTKKKEKTEHITSLNLPSEQAVFFDEGNPNWDPNPEFSMMFLRGQQNYWNDMLHVRGHVFLNEVLESLGFEHTQSGSVLGWIMGGGDNYIDFGLYNQNDSGVRRFVNGKDNCILLDFNHDGVIWDKLDNP